MTWINLFWSSWIRRGSESEPALRVPTVERASPQRIFEPPGVRGAAASPYKQTKSPAAVAAGDEGKKHLVRGRGDYRIRIIFLVRDVFSVSRR